MRHTAIIQGTHKVSCLTTPVQSYLLGGRLPVFGLVLLAQEKAGHLHLGSTAMGDIAVTSRFARGGLNLGIRFAWDREREDSLSRPLEGARRPILSHCISSSPGSQLTRSPARGPAGAVRSVGGAHGRGRWAFGFLRFALPARNRCIRDRRVQLKQRVQVALEHKLRHGSVYGSERRPSSGPCRGFWAPPATGPTRPAPPRTLPSQALTPRSSQSVRASTERVLSRPAKGTPGSCA